MSDMRDECIALEAARIAMNVLSDDRPGVTFGQIAEQAIAKVDEASAKGELGLLWSSWTRDPEGSRS